MAAVFLAVKRCGYIAVVPQHGKRCSCQTLVHSNVKCNMNYYLAFLNDLEAYCQSVKRRIVQKGQIVVHITFYVALDESLTTSVLLIARKTAAISVFKRIDF